MEMPAIMPHLMCPLNLILNTKNAKTAEPLKQESRPIGPVNFNPAKKDSASKLATKKPEERNTEKKPNKNDAASKGPKPGTDY